MAASSERRALQVVGAVVGIALGAYSGVHLLIPLAATAAAWWAGRELLPASRRDVLPPAAAQAGHWLWLMFGLVVRGVLDASAIDVLVLAIGVAWLVMRPGLAPTILLTLYQGYALLMNGAGFIQAEVGTMPHRALLIHLIWRVLALVLLWRAYAASRLPRVAGARP